MRRSGNRSTGSGVALLLVALAVWLPASARAEGVSAQVVRVVDGDTMELAGSNGQQRVRLVGIDCPERGQPFGRRARDGARDLAAGRRVTVESVGTDQYGRVLARLVLPDGRTVNHELVRLGLAWWYRPYRAEPVLGMLETEARWARRGLWSEPNPEPPWVFRRRMRERR